MSFAKFEGEPAAEGRECWGDLGSGQQLPAGDPEAGQFLPTQRARCQQVGAIVGRESSVERPRTPQGERVAKRRI